MPFVRYARGMPPMQLIPAYDTVHPDFPSAVTQGIRESLEEAKSLHQIDDSTLEIFLEYSTFLQILTDDLGNSTERRTLLSNDYNRVYHTICGLLDDLAVDELFATSDGLQFGVFPLLASSAKNSYDHFSTTSESLGNLDSQISLRADEGVTGNGPTMVYRKVRGVMLTIQSHRYCANIACRTSTLFLSDLNSDSRS